MLVGFGVAVGIGVLVGTGVDVGVAVGWAVQVFVPGLQKLHPTILLQILGLPAQGAPQAGGFVGVGVGDGA